MRAAAAADPSGEASAKTEETQKASESSFFIPATLPTAQAWRHENYDFSNENAARNIPPSLSDAALYGYDNANSALDSAGAGIPKFKEDNIGDQLLDKVPYKKQMKYTWKLMKGDEDLYFENLRVDRGNKGLVYKTNYVPFMGETQGTQIKVEVGEDTQLTYKSDAVPGLQRIEGLDFKVTAGSDSAISLRYSKPLY